MQQNCYYCIHKCTSMTLPEQGKCIDALLTYSCNVCFVLCTQLQIPSGFQTEIAYGFLSFPFVLHVLFISSPVISKPCFSSVKYRNLEPSHCAVLLHLPHTSSVSIPNTFSHFSARIPLIHVRGKVSCPDGGLSSVYK